MAGSDQAEHDGGVRARDGGDARGGASAVSISRASALDLLEVPFYMIQLMLDSCSPFGGVWFKMIAGTMSLPARDDFWAPVQQSLVRGVLGFLPVLDDRGLVASPPHAATSKPVVTYISRQGAGRRLRDGDHAGLVAALEEMEREGVLELNVVMMELLGLKEQIGVAAKSTVGFGFFSLGLLMMWDPAIFVQIILGVHGNGLTVSQEKLFFLTSNVACMDLILMGVASTVDAPVQTVRCL